MTPSVDSPGVAAARRIRDRIETVKATDPEGWGRAALPRDPCPACHAPFVSLGGSTACVRRHRPGCAVVRDEVTT